MPLTVETVPIAALSEDPENAMRHSGDNLARIRNSLERFGQVEPLVVMEESGRVIGGNGRLAVMREMGVKSVDVVRYAGSEEEARALALALNQSAEGRAWDTVQLAQQLEGLPSELRDAAGWDEKGLAAALNDAAKAVLAEGEEREGEDEVPEPPPDPVTKAGDLWLLGEHRLLCGDCRDQGLRKETLGGAEVGVVFTDPPYNIDYRGVSGRFGKIANDSMTDADFAEFLASALIPCDVMYVCCSWQYSHLFRDAMRAIGFPAKAMIVWDKVNPAQHLDLYFKQHELILYCGPFGGQKTVRGDVWQLKRQRNELHPTMKPVELVELALMDHPSRRVVWDGFCGSGSTVIAAEKCGRSARCMEVDPAYCDVIVARWEQFTGKKAERAK